ncbi:chemotaxis protein MotD [Hyphomicrobium sp. 1Nfss2.1]|uniref:flagellar hook-length control protein FliK n=1 Tax=Hyphomicrobium sp. 1Nfss2.1 TaxID=3413936 RepID=UPI003C7A3888
MTTPGSVAAQIPARAAPVGARDSGTKGDAPADDGDSGFGDVLNKLEQGDGRAPKDVAPRQASRSTERAGARDQDAAQQSAGKADAAEADFTADLFAEIDLTLGSDDTLADVAVPAGQAAAADVLGLSAIAAAALNAQQTPVANSPESQQPQPSQPQHAAAPITADVAQDIANAAASANDAAAASDRLDTDRALPGAQQPSPADVMVEGADAELPPAQLAASAAAAVPQRSEQPGQTKRTATNVLRQEAHFAPVTSPTAGPQPHATNEDGKLPGQGAERLAADQSAAAPADGIMTSADDLSSAMTRPAQQIADQVVSEAGTGPEFIERLTSPADQTGSKPALKVLHIQLQPIDLGTVTVRMELKDQELTVHVEADRSDTADMIRADQDTLAKLLRGAGYNIDTASVRIADAGSSGQQVSQTSAGTNLQSQAQSQSGPSAHQRQGQGEGQRGSANGDTNPQISRNDSYETTNTRSSGGVYI